MELGLKELGILALGEPGESTGGIETPEPEIFIPEAADEEWPVDFLKPRDIGIYPIAAPIGGGVALTGKEPTIDSGAGFWRLVLGAIPVKTRANILRFRGLEASLEGRGRTIAVPFYDGKRAPWPGNPGGIIEAESAGAVPEGSTNINIVTTNIADIQVGMHFAAGQRIYRIKSLNAESNVLSCEIWPKTREEIPSGTSLDFRRPTCIMRLARDDGMSLELDGLKHGEATVEFVEAI